MNNKDNILQCALELFSSKGYEAVGVQEIVNSAKITKPTMYHYFNNKRGLLDAIIKEYTANFIVGITAASQYKGDVATTIYSTIEKYFQLAIQNTQYFRLKMALWFSPENSEPHSAIKPYLELENNLIETMFKLMADDHGNMKDRHQQYAVSFLGTINTYIGIGLNGYLKLDSQLIHKIQHQFLHGIYS